jgi:hypothetical protein
MSSQRVCLVALVALTIAACSAGPATKPTDIAQATLPPVTAAPVANPEPPTDPPTPKLTPKPTSVPVPPKPTKVTFDAQSREIVEGYSYEITQTVTWRSPRAEGVEIRAYGVTECLAEPAHAKPGSGGPCLVRHTPLPASVRTLLATAPASAGKVAWSWIEEDPGCDPYSIGTAPDGQSYRAVVAAAYNASGHSIFVIAEPGGWSVPGPGDMAC